MMSIDLNNSKEWTAVQEKVYRKQITIELDYWDNHSIDLLSAVKSMSVGEVVSELIADKLDEMRPKIDKLQIDSKSQPLSKSIFARLQLLIRLVESDPKIRRLVEARLKANGNR